jgi:hypothetical protein
MRGEIVLLDEQHGQTASRGVACDTRAIDPATHDEQIVPAALRHLPCLLCPPMPCGYRRNKTNLSMFVCEI